LLAQQVPAARRPAYVSEESDEPEQVVEAKGGPLTWEEREEIRNKRKKEQKYQESLRKRALARKDLKKPLRRTKRRRR
jgi:hypothetical protein